MAVLPAVPEESVELLLPMAPVPVVPEESVEPVEGMVEGVVDGAVEEGVEDVAGVLAVSSAVLLQPASAIAAAKATATAEPVLSSGAFISVFPLKKWERLTASQMSIYLLANHCLHETHA